MEASTEDKSDNSKIYMWVIPSTDAQQSPEVNKLDATLPEFISIIQRGEEINYFSDIPSNARGSSISIKKREERAPSSMNLS